MQHIALIPRKDATTPYSATYNSQGLYAEALTEYRNQAVPELKAYVPNLADYDIILLGYCNWWASIPAPVRSFLIHDDFSGKTIVPFCSMGGGRFGQTISATSQAGSRKRHPERYRCHLFLLRPPGNPLLARHHHSISAAGRHSYC